MYSSHHARDHTPYTIHHTPYTLPHKRTVLVDNNTWNNTHIATVGRVLASTEEEAYPILEVGVYGYERGYEYGV
ncbi:hypothetical protein EON63_21190 [archaeon]|nr:MAG: hypothetical protein EON63_21190 [archaeon]